MLATDESANRASRTAVREINTDIREIRVIEMRKSKSSFWNRKRRLIVVAIIGACVAGVLLAVLVLIPTMRHGITTVSTLLPSTVTMFTTLLSSTTSTSATFSIKPTTPTAPTTPTDPTTTSTIAPKTLPGPPSYFACDVDYSVTSFPPFSNITDCYTYCNNGGLACAVSALPVSSGCITSYFGLPPGSGGGSSIRRRRGISTVPRIDLNNSGICIGNTDYYCCCSSPPAR